jgi:hypothetical protein
MTTSIQISLPDTWINTEGTIRKTGPGHTSYKNWDNDFAIPVLISYDSYTNEYESVIGKAVGLYFENKKNSCIGIIISKLMKAGWTPGKLVLHDNIHHLLDLKTNVLIAGDAHMTFLQVLQNLHDQLSNSRVKNDGGLKMENKYIQETMSYLNLDRCKAFDINLDSLFDELDNGQKNIISRIKGSMDII